MILIAYNRIPRRKTCPSVALCSRNVTCTGLGSNPDLCCERPATNRLSCCKNTSRHKSAQTACQLRQLNRARRVCYWLC